MSQQTDHQMSQLFQRAMADVAGDEALVARVVTTGVRRTRRRRVGYGLGVAAVATTAVFSLSWVDLPGGSETGRGEQVYAESPSAPTLPAPYRVPTADELSATLAAALPATSSETRRERMSEGAPMITRRMGEGTVTAVAYVYQDRSHGLPMAPDMVYRCQHTSRVTGCRATEQGWITWMLVDDTGRELVSDSDSRDVVVAFFRRDGLVIDLRSTNYVDIAHPTSIAPVVSKDDLVELATTVDWFPAEAD